METRQLEKTQIAVGRKIVSAVTPGAVIFALGLLAILFIKPFIPYGILAGITLFVLSFIVNLLGTIRQFSYLKCPQCSQSLKRKSFQEGEYACEVCGVKWVL
jgi:hypothetical protein